MGACNSKTNTKSTKVVTKKAQTYPVVSKPATQIPPKAEPVKAETANAQPAATQLDEAQPIASEKPAEAEPSKLTSIGRVQEDIDHTIYRKFWTGDVL